MLTVSIPLRIKDATDTVKSASNLDLHLEMDIEGWLRTKLYDNRHDFNFPVVNFHLYVTTFQQQLHMGYIFLCWSYMLACGFYQDFLDRGWLLTTKLLNHRFLLLSCSHHFDFFTVAIMTCLTATEYMYIFTTPVWDLNGYNEWNNNIPLSIINISWHVYLVFWLVWWRVL